MKKIGLSLLLLSIMEISFAGSPGTYREQADEMMDLIKTMLIANKYCQDEHDCRGKYTILTGTTSDGFEITAYEIKNKK